MNFINFSNVFIIKICFYFLNINQFLINIYSGGHPKSAYLKQKMSHCSTNFTSTLTT